MSAPPLSTDVQALVLERLSHAHPDIDEWAQETKECGRHAGSVFAAGDLRYFVKQQRFCLRTLYVYHLLATVGCGPQPFFVLAHHLPSHSKSDEEEAFEMVVATRAVPGFSMASHQGDHCALLSAEDAACLVLLVCCLGLGDIPDNTDNWGTASPRRRVAIVDFSFARFQGLNAVAPMASLRTFIRTCRPFIAADRRHKQRHTDHADCDRDHDHGDNDYDSDATFMAAFQSAHGQWFGRTDAFDRLLETAMGHTRDWVNDDTHQHEWRCAQSMGSTCSTS